MTKFAELVESADQAGRDAVTKSTVAPMVVKDGDKEWIIEGGACGFAWINITPGNCAFANYAKKHAGARKSYSGGVDISVFHYNQSMARNETYARAYAVTLRSAGITAFAQSRMD